MEEKVQYQSEERIRDIHDQLAGKHLQCVPTKTLRMYRKDWMKTVF